MTIRSYSELIKLKTFEERFKYCLIGNIVGEETFGSDRYFNQQFYSSKEWRAFRRKIIIRDGGKDLGIEECPIIGGIYIHHLNPLSMAQLKEADPSKLFDPENYISVSFATHQALHYGYEPPYRTEPVERTKWDTCPWKE